MSLLIEQSSISLRSLIYLSVKVKYVQCMCPMRVQTGPNGVQNEVRCAHLRLIRSSYCFRGCISASLFPEVYRARVEVETERGRERTSDNVQPQNSDIGNWAVYVNKVLYSLTILFFSTFRHKTGGRG